MIRSHGPIGSFGNCKRRMASWERTYAISLHAMSILIAIGLRATGRFKVQSEVAERQDQYASLVRKMQDSLPFTAVCLTALVALAVAH